MTAYEQATATTALPTDRPVTETAKSQAGAVAGTAKDEAGNIAGAATNAVAEVAGTAKEQVGQVAGEAKNQLGALTSQAKVQVAEQAQIQTMKAAAGARGLADQLQALARGEATEGVASDIAKEISTRVQALATKLENSEPQDLLDEVRRYARNKPGMFLIAALTAGFVGGRLVKGASSEEDSSSPKNAWTSGANTPASGSHTTYTPANGAGGTTDSGFASPSSGVLPSYGAATYPDEPRTTGLRGSI